MLIHGDLSQVGKHAVLANPSSKGPREFIVLSEMQAGAEYGDFSTADGEKITSMISFFLGRSSVWICCSNTMNYRSHAIDKEQPT